MDIGVVLALAAITVALVLTLRLARSDGGPRRAFARQPMLDERDAERRDAPYAAQFTEQFTSAWYRTP